MQFSGNVKMLVVDDETEITDFLREFFAERGCQAYVANNRDTAIELASRHKPDVILLDMRLPGAQDGFDVLSEVKKNLPQTKVIMVTGVEDQASMDKAMALGASSYITKPLSLEYLEHTVVEKVQEAISGSSKSS